MLIHCNIRPYATLSGMSIRVRVGDNKPPQGPMWGNPYMDGGYWNGYYSGNQLCVVYTGGMLAGGPTVLTCAQPMVGRYLTLQLQPSDALSDPVLTICELQVFSSE